MSPIRIEHVVLSLHPGGLENGVVNLVNGLDRLRFQSSVCCLQDAGPFATRITTPGVEVVAMGLEGGLDLGVVRRLTKHFRTRRPCIVHTRNAESFFYGCLAARMAGVPRLVHSEHGRTFSDRRIRFLAQRWMSRFADSIVSVSEQLKRDLVTHIGLSPKRIEVLHNGVDLARFGASIPSAAERQALGIGPGEIVVGSVGRLAAVKNYGLLLRAAAATPHPGLHVVLVGDGPERPALAELAEQLGIDSRVHLLGHRDDVGRLLGMFDLFVLPSLSEGMSNTLLEAMAHGVTPLVSDVGGNTEIVQHGQTGLVFESGNEAMLAGQIARLCADQTSREQLGAAARVRVSEAFGLDGMIERYQDLYARVAAGRPRC